MTLDKTESYVRERIELHREAKVRGDWNEDLPPCTQEDRWVRETKYAVKKEGRKTAVRVLDNEADAKVLAEEVKGFVEIRNGEAVRCTGNFCGVSQWCKQYQKELKETV